ncbi:precorrin-3B synthase [Kushneria sinocarnis]|uniref:Precorrin-3B synthase n=1 Tax=Kushneria sinocarnis TaxID=595502 RepID=A0A420X1A5_9GAMM|nr:hypothetical protein [Kushneria sinocarnis]RKR07530.1 precorrin-3B synthase [Kushneria sinocarnis]
MIPFATDTSDGGDARRRQGLRRGACPTLHAPMATGDGHLARLPPLPRGLGVAETIVLCEAAERLGNGIIELTRRGNLQLRGLQAEDVGRLPRELAGHPGHASASVIGSDLLDPRAPAITLDALMACDAGLDDTDRAVAGRLRERLLAAGVEGLAPKVAVVIDAGGEWAGLDRLSADLRIRLVRDSDGERRGWLGLAGDADTVTWLGDIGLARLAEGAEALLEAIAACGPRARGRDLLAHRAPLQLCEVLGLRPAIAWVRPRPPERPVVGADSQQLEIHWPFGQLEATTLLQLTRAARRCGADTFAPAPGRRWRVAGHGSLDVAALAHRARTLGLITDPDDPRLSLESCVGAAGCASGQLMTRTLAADIAAAAAPLCDGSVSLHLSGCTKGCARPNPATLVLTGTPEGVTLGLEARADDSGQLVALAAERLPQAVAQLARRVQRVHRHGETMRETLVRLGEARLAAWLAATE